MKRAIFFISAGLLFVAANSFYIKKLKLSKRYKAVYSSTIGESYTVDKSTDSTINKEQAKSHVNMVFSQDVLEKKKHVLELDYLIREFTRKDSIKINKQWDTSSNRGEIPRRKNIFFFTDKGKYLGAALANNTPRLRTRDHKYFYKVAQQTVYEIYDSAKYTSQWQTIRTDTIQTTGFQLVFTFPLQWKVEEQKDTLEREAVVLSYTSPAAEYFSVNSMMKALGIETYHKGVAAINGSLLVDAKTGRVIRLNEYGSFIGSVEMKTAKKNIVWPSVYRYNKHFVLDSLIKKPRKKIFGIF